jgi:hypothetical protein
MAKVKRSEFKTFIDTTPASTPTWSLLGVGVTTGAINYNPEVTTETYIHEDNATTTVERYAPTFPIEAQANNGDAVFEYIDGLRRSRAIGSNAETDILLVYLYETPVSTDQYPAELQPVSIQIDSFGGDGGTITRINFTINFRGNPTTGLYDVSSNSFA